MKIVVAVTLLVLSSVRLTAQDVFVPPTPIGIAKDGKVRTPKRPIPLPAADQRWIRVRTQHFDLISSASERRTFDIARDLETVAATLIQENSRFQRATVPTTVFVFSRRRESQPYFDLLIGGERSRATGAYVRHDGGGSMFIDAGRKSFERTAMHELVHDLLRQNETSPPLWVEEGLAEYFANASIRPDGLVAGQDIAEHVQLIARTSRSFSDVIAVTVESPGATAPQFYARSWAAVDWLMEVDRDTFWRFSDALEAGTSLNDALRTHYGKTIDDLERAVAKVGRARRIVRFPRAAVAGGAPVSGEIDRATLLFELGRFLSHVAGAEADVQRHYVAALAADPNHARTLAAVGEFERAIASGTRDAEVYLTYAESLMTMAVGPFAGVFEQEPDDAEKFRKARGLAGEALRLARRNETLELEGRAHGLAGTTYLVEDDVAPGIAHLERARQLVPQRIDFMLNLYAMYLRAGDRASAEVLFAAVFENARDKQVAFAARNVRLVSETQRANDLAKSGRLDDAAAVVRELAAATADPQGRRDLEAQAEMLESTAMVNRHIVIYNDAVALANTQRNREAVRLLDELLEVATDPGVVRDAERLRTSLRKRR